MKDEILKKVYANNKNLIIDGDISTGKTTNIVFPLVDEMINLNESLFILDPREEYIKKFYNKAKEKNYNAIIINLKDANKSVGWNPLEYPYNLYKGNCIDLTINYLEQIGKELFNENLESDPFWEDSASSLFVGSALGIFKDAKENEINFVSINNIFNSNVVKKDGEDYLIKYLKTKNTLDPIYTYLSPTALAPSETKASIMTVAKQKLRVLISRESVVKMLNKTTFNFDDVVNKPTIIFFVAKEEKTTLNVLASIFIRQLYSILEDNVLLNKFNFVLDNLDMINENYELINMLSSGIHKNIKFTLVTRDKNNIKEKYGNYIDSLTNEIKLTDSKIIIKMGEKETELDNSIPEKVEDVNIEYPMLNDVKVNYFDVIKYIDNIDIKLDEIIDGIDQNLSQIKQKNNLIENKELEKTNKIDTDDLLKRIDNKIEELDKIEQEKKKKENLNKDNIDIDELIKKIDDKISELDRIEQEEKEKENIDKSNVQEINTDEIIKKIDTRIAELDKKIEQELDEEKAAEKDVSEATTDNKDIQEDINYDELIKDIDNKIEKMKSDNFDDIKKDDVKSELEEFKI